MIIFGDRELESFIWLHRERSNTQFVVREKNWFKTNEYYDLIQKVRTNPKWFNQVGWLKDCTQAQLEMYNPLVMSKMFLLNDAKILDKFDSEKLFWIDAGAGISDLDTYYRVWLPGSIRSVDPNDLRIWR